MSQLWFLSAGLAVTPEYEATKQWTEIGLLPWRYWIQRTKHRQLGWWQSKEATMAVLKTVRAWFGWWQDYWRMVESAGLSLQFLLAGSHRKKLVIGICSTAEQSREVLIE
jgi:hypothetical protein